MSKIINSEEENSPMNNQIMNNIEHSNIPRTLSHTINKMFNFTIERTYSSDANNTNQTNINTVKQYDTKLIQDKCISEIKTLFIRRQTPITNNNTMYDSIWTNTTLPTNIKIIYLCRDPILILTRLVQLADTTLSLLNLYKISIYLH